MLTHVFASSPQTLEHGGDPHSVLPGQHFIVKHVLPVHRTKLELSSWAKKDWPTLPQLQGFLVLQLNDFTGLDVGGEFVGAGFVGGGQVGQGFAIHGFAVGLDVGGGGLVIGADVGVGVSQPPLPLPLPHDLLWERFRLVLFRNCFAAEASLEAKARTKMAMKESFILKVKQVLDMTGRIE